MRWVIYHLEQRKMEALNRTDYTAEDFAPRPDKPGPRGKRTTSQRDELMALAAEQVYFVRELWRREYPEEGYRRERDNHPSAVAIVAEYLGFDDEATAELFGYDEETREKLLARVKKKKIRRPLTPG